VEALEVLNQAGQGLSIREIISHRAVTAEMELYQQVQMLEQAAKAP